MNNNRLQISERNVDSRGRIWTPTEWRRQRGVEYRDSVLVGVGSSNTSEKAFEQYPLPLRWFTTEVCSKGEITIPKHIRSMFDLNDGGSVNYIIAAV